VRRTVERWLTPGATNLANLDRNCIHGFVAGPRGARGLDITTRIREKTPSRPLEVAKEPFDAELSIWDAR
jgi:hypothetical protein